MFTIDHLKAIENQCTLISILHATLHLSEYGSQAYWKQIKDLEEAHVELRNLFDEAKLLLQGDLR